MYTPYEIELSDNIPGQVIEPLKVPEREIPEDFNIRRKESAMQSEKRLIDANRLKMRMIAFATAIKREYLSIEGIVDTINTESTVDAEEVVRCRNCKHYSNQAGVCRWYRRTKFDDGFCDRGERKDDAE